MKRFYLLCLALVASLSSMAQQSVTFQINHWLGTSPFQFGVAASNNNGHAFKVRRLQYYIAEITLVHDGGIQTVVPDTWILVDAGQPTTLPLGSFPVTNLEAVRFSIGVQASYNHLNPTTYPVNHPLALQSPSMHWGWAGGYRFVAMEGTSGSNFAQTYELHGLDDANYFQTEVVTSGTMNGQDLVIDLHADYERALENIDVSSGPIAHGGSGIARTILLNFRDYVFTATTATAVAPAVQSTFGLAPNPTAAHTRLSLAPSLVGKSTVVVYDMTGRIVQTVDVVGSVTDLHVDAAGCYMVAVQHQGHTVGTQRLLVTH